MATTKNKISDLAKEEAVALYLSGLTQDQVAAKLGIARGCTISGILRQKGIKARPVQWNKMPDATRLQAIQMYVDHKMTIPETAQAVGVSTSCIARWLKAANATRPMGEAFSLAAQKGRKQWGKSVNIPWQSKKTGRWEFADSRWEVVRMGQLDKDVTVRHWTRLAERIPYIDAAGRHRFYAPDFIIEYADGTTVVEEVKPKVKVNTPSTLMKAAAAASVLGAKGIDYRIVTEDDIGIAAIRAFRLEGLASITDEQRRLAHNRRKVAAWHRRNGARVSAGREKRQARNARIIAAYKSGKTLLEVAREFKVSPHAIQNSLKRSGVPRRAAVMRAHERRRQGDRMRARAGLASQNQMSLL